MLAIGQNFLKSFEPRNLEPRAYEPRSSRQRCSVKKSVFRNFTKFTGKHLCQSLFFNKVAGLRPANSCEFSEISVNFAKFLRIPFLQNSSGRVLLQRLFTGPFLEIYMYLQLSSNHRERRNVIICVTYNK